MKNRIMDLRTFLILVICSVLVFSVVATNHEVEKQKVQFYNSLQEAGIDGNQIQGCTNQCSFQNGVLTLGPGANAKSVPKGVKEIKLNGGSAAITGGKVSGNGVLKTNPLTIIDGKLDFNGLNKNTNIDFLGTTVKDSNGATVTGHGKVINGRIHIQSGTAKIGKKEYGVVDAIVLDVDDKSGSLSLQTGKGFKIREGKGSISVDAGRQVIIGENEFGEKTIQAGKLYDPETDKVVDNKAPPVFTVIGKPNINIEDHSGAFGFKAAQTVIIDGKKHSFQGRLNFRNGITFIPKTQKRKMSMIDGVYLRVGGGTEVAVFFDDKKREGDYIGLGKDLRAGGRNFKIILSEKGGKYPVYSRYDQKAQRKIYSNFPIDNAINKYAIKDKKENAPFRLVIDMGDEDKDQDGDVLISPSKKKITVSGRADVINGPNKVIYKPENGKTTADFQYIGCSEPWKSCTELDYDQHDGGRINVVKEIGTPPVESGKTKVDFHFGGKEFVDDADNRKVIPLTLQKDQVYVLAYRGGAAAESLSEAGKEKFEWGHVGILFFKDGKPFVAESDGASVGITPLKDSLFGKDYDAGKLHGVWMVRESSEKKLHAGEVIQFAEQTVGSPYTYNPYKLQRQTHFQCSSFVTACVEAGTHKNYKTKVSFKDRPDAPFWVKAAGKAAAVSQPTPRSVLGNEHLPNSNLIPLVKIPAKKSEGKKNSKSQVIS